MALTAVKRAIATRIEGSFPRMWLERELRSRPAHFEPEMWLVPLFCDKSTLAIDVGINTGTYAYYMSKFAGQVIGFEPNADLWGHLRRVLGQDFRIEGVALSGENTTRTMRIDATNTGVSTIEGRNELACVADRSRLETRTVETRTLDSYGFAGVSLIKIDVEGHEESVIDGATETLARCRPALVIESEDRHNAGAPGRLRARLGGAGYAGYFLKGGRLMEFAALTEDDMDPAKDGYVNNFLFIPVEQGAKVAEVEAFLSAMRRE